MTRSTGGRVKQSATRSAQQFRGAVSRLRHGQDFFGELAALRGRVAELEESVQENRRLNRRIAELTDIVQELLLPAVDRDDDRLLELLDRYSEKL